MATDALIPMKLITPIRPQVLTNQSVAFNHGTLLDNGQNLNRNMENIVEILGGIDTILQIHLHQTELPSLTNYQLQQLNNIIISANNHNKISDVSILQISASNTLIHRIFKWNTATTFINILLSKYLTGFIGFLWILWIIEWFLDAFTNNEFSQIYFIKVWDWISILFFVPYVMLVCTSVNITIAKQIFLTFECWLKLLYYLRFWICSGLSIQQAKIYSLGYIINAHVQHIGFFSFILMYNVIDGLQISFRHKALVLTLGATYATLHAFHLTFQLNADQPFYHEQISIFGREYDIDLEEFMAASYRVLAIFMWKQTIYSMYRPDLATSLYKPVRIIFRHDQCI